MGGIICDVASTGSVNDLRFGTVDSVDDIYRYAKVEFQGGPLFGSLLPVRRDFSGSAINAAQTVRDLQSSNILSLSACNSAGFLSPCSSATGLSEDISCSSRLP